MFMFHKVINQKVSQKCKSVFRTLVIAKLFLRLTNFRFVSIYSTRINKLATFVLKPIQAVYR